MHAPGAVPGRFLAGVAIALLLACGRALGQSATLALTATVEAACQSSAGTANTGLDFGTLDFGEHGSLDNAISVASTEQAGSIGVTCVSGQSYVITLDGGGSGDPYNRMLKEDTSGANIRYNLYTSAARDTVWDDRTGVTAVGNGSMQWHAVYGLVPAQATPAAGTYRDTVNVTINW